VGHEGSIKSAHLPVLRMRDGALRSDVIRPTAWIVTEGGRGADINNREYFRVCVFYGSALISIVCLILVGLGLILLILTASTKKIHCRY
jgi:hypothetical protein